MMTGYFLRQVEQQMELDAGFAGSYLTLNLSPV